MKKAIVYDFRSLPAALREAGAVSAIAELKAGATQVDVAENYGTSPLTVLRWKKMGESGVVEFKHRGRPNESGKAVKKVVPNSVDYRLLPPALREAGKIEAVKRVKAGAKVDEVATDFGLNVHTLMKWADVQSPNAGKRGRPKKVAA